MALKRILTRAGAKMGLNPKDPLQRQVLLAYANEAAEELYSMSDPPGSLVEQNFKVNGDQSITFPAEFGKLRAIRESASMQIWHINQMRPRYNQFNWVDMWRNWRVKNTQTLMNSVTNQTVGVITVLQVESPPIQVSVTGPTNQANSISETIIMDSISKQTVNAYLDYSSVKKDRVNNYDVTLSDLDGRMLTVIPNNLLWSQYQLVDISAAPWLPQNTSKLDNYVEVLYKKALTWLQNDEDEYPAFNMDRILVNKILQLWAEEQEKVDIALAYDTKATRSLAQLTEDQNRETEDMVALVAHPHDTLLKRIGTGIRRRYSLYAGRKY